MNNTDRFITRALALGLAAGLGTAAQAADVYLRASSFQKDVPTNATGTTVQPVTMWGYGTCDATFTNCLAPTSPGPQITVPVGESSLTIHLQNMLPEATSIMIPGQSKVMTPQTFSDGLSRPRIKAFDAEAASSGGTHDYTWNNLSPGTYLYQSASHTQLQVQMGLYGAVVRDHAPAAVPTTPVAVANPGFEEPDCDTAPPGTCTIDAALGNYTIGTASGWTVSGAAGVFGPTSVIVPTEGKQVGYSNGGTLSQEFGVLAANTTYTLSVDVGDRTDTEFPGYTVGLYVGNTLLKEVVGAAGSVTSGWKTETLTYATGATVPSGQFRIQLGGVGVQGGQTEFDKVSLLKAASVALAYPDVAYDRARTVIFSEVDPRLHDPAPKAANLTVDGYRPSFFLVNGQPFVNARALDLANGGFEEPDCDTAPAGACTIDAALGNYTIGTASGWAVSGAAGVFDPIGVVTATEGHQVGYSNGGTLSQALGEAPAANTTYTLSVDVGDRTDSAFPGYTIALYSGATLLEEFVGAAGSVTSDWTTATLTYTSGATPPSDPLEIRLSSAGGQTEFDDVRLFASQMTTAPVLVGSRDLVTAAPGERVLLRLLNAGLQNRAPMLLGGHFEIVAEDGHVTPVRRQQYDTLLPAGKALDVIFVPTGTAGTVFPLYDRRLGLDNGSGQLGRIAIGP